MPPTRPSKATPEVVPAAASKRPAKKTSARPEKSHEIQSFRQRLTQFLTNKAVAEAATARNEGDKKSGTPGLKEPLKTDVMRLGEVDPESGSYFVELDPPILIPESGLTYKRVKAERRGGNKTLNVERATAWLEEIGLLDEVEQFSYSLRLPAGVAGQFAEWLKENDFIQYVTGTGSVFVEDNLLALHHRRKPDSKERILPEATLDGFYDVADPTFAFKPLTS